MRILNWKRIAMIAASVGMCLAAMATEFESASFTALNSDGPEGNAANGVGTFTSAGGYALRKMTIQGEVSRVDSGDFASEKRIKITAPNAMVLVVTPIVGVFGYTNETCNLSVFGPWVNQDPAGTWEFRCFESVDDGGPGTLDGVWTSLRFGFTDESLDRPDSEAMGFACDPGSSFSFDLAAGTVRWFRIDISEATVASKFLRINTNGSVVADTEIGLYRDDATGTLVANDDDDGDANWSQLSFGDGAQDGIIPAGSYYLAVGAFNMTFGADQFSVSTTSSTGGSITVNMVTNLACPVVSGTIELAELDGSPNGLEVLIEIRRVGDPNPLHTLFVALDASGTYSFNSSLPNGSYDVAAKGTNWLRRLNNSIAFSNGAANVDFVLINGDADPDNEVNLVDVSSISAAFGSVEGDSHWNPNADLNKDGEVNLVDYAIAASSFGSLGDE